MSERLIINDLFTYIVTGIKELPRCGKEFFTFLEENSDRISQTIDILANFNRDTTRKLCSLSEAKDAFDLILKAINGACSYIGSVGDLLHYGKEINSESIKDDIRNGSTKKLNQFIQKMNKWLELTKLSYIDYTDKCDGASKKFIELAEAYALYEAEEGANKKKTRIMGGIVSAVAYLCGLSAIPNVAARDHVLRLRSGGVLIISLVTGIGLTLWTHETACHYRETEAKFKVVSATFRGFAKQGRKLRHECDEFQINLERYENNCMFADSTERDDQDTLCSALDNMKRILEEEQFEISKVKDNLRSLKDKLMEASLQLYN